MQKYAKRMQMQVSQWISPAGVEICYKSGWDWKKWNSKKVEKENTMSERRFTPAAEGALRLAQEAAAELGHGHVGTEHLLVGLVRQGEGIAYAALCAVGITEVRLMEILRRSGGGLPGNDPHQGLTPRGKRAVELAVEEALHLGERCVGTEHLLWGILCQGSNAAQRMLRAAGADPRQLQAMLAQKQSDGIRGRIGRERTPPKEETVSKTLRECSRDLTAEARAGKLDPVIGREKEICRVIQILSRRTKNNPCLLGEPGVGKTAVAEGLARRIAAGDVPEELLEDRILSLDIAGMVAGTKYRGEFEDRIRKVLEEVKRAGNIILFLDELHTVVGAGSAEGAVDAANILKPALGRGEIRLIGATTLGEYRKYIEKDPALERRFQSVVVDQPTAEGALEILRGLRRRYEAHHGLSITEEALSAAVQLSVRYIPGRFLPDKAIDLVDEAASRVRMEEESGVGVPGEKNRSCRGGRCVGAEDVAAVVAAWTGVPVTELTEDEGQKLLRLEETLQHRLVGQEKAVMALSRAVRRSRVGLKEPNRPVGSFLFLGPTGVGKTELCKALAEVLFGSEQALMRFDMSEYMERHSVSRLIGSPPGYVGHEEGGELTEKVRRRPYCVVLFDEVEKAHEDVWNLLLQVLDDGRITDSQGRTVDFCNAVVIMTSNVGARHLTDPESRLGFRPEKGKEQEEREDAVMETLRKTFRPEFLNRVDETILFRPLKQEEMEEVARRMLRELSRRMADLGIALEVEERVVSLLAKRGYDPKYGARPLRRVIRAGVEDPLAEEILCGRLSAGDTAVLSLEGEELRVRTGLTAFT